jgi:hypothetical protein
MNTIIPQKLNNSTNMQNNDQIAIFESYRDDILAKFKKSLEGKSEKEKEIENIKEPVSDTDNDDSEISEIDIEDSEIEDIEPPKKKNVIVRSQEVGVKIDPKLKEIIKHLPEIIEDIHILSDIKYAIKEVNNDIASDEDQIKDSPLSIYDQLMAAGIYNEEEVMEDDERLSSEEKGEDLEDDAFTVDDYYDDEDLSGEKEFNLSKKTRSEREDLKSGMRRDIERSRAEDILRQMGVDFEDRRGFSDDDY